VGVIVIVAVDAHVAVHVHGPVGVIEKFAT
jgi:hypothetical protein